MGVLWGNFDPAGVKPWLGFGGPLGARDFIGRDARVCRRSELALNREATALKSRALDAAKCLASGSIDLSGWWRLALEERIIAIPRHSCEKLKQLLCGAFWSFLREEVSARQRSSLQISCPLAPGGKEVSWRRRRPEAPENQHGTGYLPPTEVGRVEVVVNSRASSIVLAACANRVRIREGMFVLR